MIETKTVFVLGAGASMPYGFPSGAELRTEIVDAQNDNWLLSQLVQDADLDGSEVKDFARAFHRSQIASIDSFLTLRPEFVAIGRAAIASCLCRREQREALGNENNDDHWYKHLWNAMVGGTTKVLEVRHNKVKFMTFGVAPFPWTVFRLGHKRLSTGLRAGRL